VPTDDFWDRLTAVSVDNGPPRFRIEDDQPQMRRGLVNPLFASAPSFAKRTTFGSAYA
jgi:hypothetical protein